MLQYHYFGALELRTTGIWGSQFGQAQLKMKAEAKEVRVHRAFSQNHKEVYGNHRNIPTQHVQPPSMWDGQPPRHSRFAMLIFGANGQQQMESSYMGVSLNAGTPKSFILIGFPL